MLLSVLTPNMEAKGKGTSWPILSPALLWFLFTSSSRRGSACILSSNTCKVLLYFQMSNTCKVLLYFKNLYVAFLQNKLGWFIAFAVKNNLREEMGVPCPSYCWVWSWVWSGPGTPYSPHHARQKCTWISRGSRCIHKGRIGDL